LPGAVALFDADGRITFANREMLDYLDETLEQVRARPSAYTYHPDDREEALGRWEAGIRSGKPFQGEARLRRGDGVYRWHRTGVFPLRNDAGAIDLWYGLSTDIDDTKRAQALLAGEKRLLELIALGQPLKAVLEALCREVETLAPGSYCDILLLGLDGKSFQVGAAGGLPQSYWATLEGKRVDPSYGPARSRPRSRLS
jgi:PAS domain S-box-containing protein